MSDVIVKRVLCASCNEPVKAEDLGAITKEGIVHDNLACLNIVSTSDLIVKDVPVKVIKENGEIKKVILEDPIRHEDLEFVYSPLIPEGI